MQLETRENRFLGKKLIKKRKLQLRSRINAKLDDKLKLDGKHSGNLEKYWGNLFTISRTIHLERKKSHLHLQTLSNQTITLKAFLHRRDGEKVKEKCVFQTSAVDSFYYTIGKLRSICSTLAQPFMWNSNYLHSTKHKDDQDVHNQSSTNNWNYSENPNCKSTNRGCFLHMWCMIEIGIKNNYTMSEPTISVSVLIKINKLW